MSHCVPLLGYVLFANCTVTTDDYNAGTGVVSLRIVMLDPELPAIGCDPAIPPLLTLA